MSVIPSFSYASTAFYLSAWIPLDGVLPWYHMGVFVLLAIIQRIFVVAGGAIDDPGVFWGWQALLTLAGVAVGYGLQLATRAPILAQIKPGWETTSLIRLPLMTALYVAAQLHYAFVLPPSSPWGLLGTTAATSVVVILTCAWLLQDPYVASSEGADRLIGYFSVWFLGNLVLCSLFWTVYADLISELVAGFIACGGALVTVVVVGLLCRCRETRGL